MDNNTKENVREIIFGTAVVFCVAAGILGIRKAWRKVFPEKDAVITEQVIRVYDTVRVYKPVIKDSLVVRYEKRRLPLYQDTTGLDPYIMCDTIWYPDSADVVLPVTQKTYEGDGYKAFVSGYDARLDSLLVSKELTTVIRTATRTKRKHWGFSAGVQAGYGVTKNGMSPYAGVGVTAGYNF